MKRIMTALLATTAFAATPALASEHGDMSGDKDMMAEKTDAKHMDAKDMDAKHMDADHMGAKDWTKESMESEVSALKASQVFLAIDDENDGLITKSEWADWQNRADTSTKQFADYDTDSDGDIELSEYLANFDVS